MSGILRVRKRDSGFSIIDNFGANDVSISWEARGVLWYLLTKPDNWTARAADIVKRGSAGRDKVYRILKELEGAGFLRRFQERDADGKVGEMIIEVYERPDLNPAWAPATSAPYVEPAYTGQKAEKASPSPDVPLPALPYTVQPYPVQPYPAKPEHNKDLDQQLLINDPGAGDYSTDPKVVDMAKAVAAVTGLYGKVNFDDVYQASVALVSSGYSGDQVRQAFAKGAKGAWVWYSNHWKGQKGQVPTLKDLQQNIGAAVHVFSTTSDQKTDDQKVGGFA